MLSTVQITMISVLHFLHTLAGQRPDIQLVSAACCVYGEIYALENASCVLHCGLCAVQTINLSCMQHGMFKHS